MNDIGEKELLNIINEFRIFVNEFSGYLNDREGYWTLRGFIDIAKNIYSIS